MINLTKYDLLLNWITENAQDILYYAIHCDTKEKAEDLIAMLYTMGFRWENDDLANKHFLEDGTVTTKWESKKEHTCYTITPAKLILFGSESYYSSLGKMICSYDELFAEASDLQNKINEEELKEEFEESSSKKNKSQQIKTLKSRICPLCHNEILNDGSKFCMECGFQIPEDFFQYIQPVIDSDSSVDDANTENDINLTEEVTGDDFTSENNSDIIKSEDVPANNLNFVVDENDKTKKLNKTAKQLIIIGVIIFIFLGVLFGVKIYQSKVNNDFGRFSENWEVVEQVSAEDDVSETEIQAEPETTAE